MRGRFLSKKVARRKNSAARKKFSVALKINSAARKNFFPPGLFFYALTFSEKHGPAVGMCAGRLEIPGRDG